MESTLYIFSYRLMFVVCFYLVATGWVFEIRLCENSIKINQPKLQHCTDRGVHPKARTLVKVGAVGGSNELHSVQVRTTNGAAVQTAVQYSNSTDWAHGVATLLDDGFTVG